MLALKLALLDNPTDAILGLADVNGDGKITAVDAMRILQYATGEITQFK
ncbi:MAG: dockerin type I domain-containing protein [Eubacterium ventriosum]